MSDTGNQLRSLSPEYDPDQHGGYVRVLLRELRRSDDDAARNIALTGHYGSGKSSVLIQVERQLKGDGVKVINLSLPSLGIGDARLKTPGDKTTLDTTNLIQKEIVKQLLYRRRPSATPASRYNRLDVYSRAQGCKRAAVAASAVTLVALLSGVPGKVKDAFPARFWSWVGDHTWHWLPIAVQWLSLLAVFGIAFGAVLGAQRLFQRLRLTELVAGPAKVTLSENSTSFFDEYLDEIVYYFQGSKTTVVIFEDLDRFEDPHIFETLRELNMLLNNAEQTGDSPIRFVYAIRDSIFEKLDAEPAKVQTKDQDEAQANKEALPASTASSRGETRRLMSTNRTKFFDLVVPMVPFISHRTSRDLIAAEVMSVEEAQRPSAEVVDIVSVHLTDMRLIKNICNEYDVFRARILGSQGLDNLTPDRLFASIVYKNIYMGDYEKIRVAESALDDLYRSYREWVAYRAAAARANEEQARSRLNRISTTSIGSRSRRLGGRLQQVLAARGPETPDPQRSQVHVGGTPYSWAQLLTAAFWQAYLSSDQDLTVVMRPPYGATDVLPFEAVQTLIGETLSRTDWETKDRADLRKQMTAATVEQRLVMQASLTDALNETGVFDYGGEEVTLDAVAHQLFEGAEMALELLRAGYIDENFTLYVTQFPGQGSASAMNFILKAVQPDVMDKEYHFGTGSESNTDDIDAVVQAEGLRLLHGRSVYNIELFDHLLATDPDKLNDAFRRLALNADSDREFIEAYLSAGNEKLAFVKRLSADWSGILRFLIGEDPESRGLDLLDAAIRGADPVQGYELDDSQRQALVTALPRLGLATNAVNSQTASSIASVFDELNVRATNIADVAEPLRSQMIARNLYEVTRRNLETIFGEDGLALDAIKAGHEENYQYILDHLRQYLAALKEPEPVGTVADRSRFGEVLADVVSNDPEALEDVAANAAEGLLLDDLSTLEPNDWPDIARARRLRLTVPLVTQYEAELGLDNAMADYLSAARSFEISEGESGRLELAMKVLNDRALEDDTKMSLLASLRLSPESITASELESHAHSLIPTLVKDGWVTDDADAFTVLGEEAWATKRALVAASRSFPSYVTSVTLSANDLRELARHAPDAVKEVLVDHYAIFEPRFGSNGATALAAWMVSKGRRPEPQVIVSLANKGKADSAASIVALLGAQATTIEIGALRDALNALGDPYDRMTAPGRSRPKPPMLQGMREVLQRLQSEGIVSRFVEKPKKNHFEVFKRYG